MQVGDLVIALCPFSEPYTVTCRGWSGIIVDIDEDREDGDTILVTEDVNGPFADKWWVNPDYFEIGGQFTQSDELSKMFAEV